MVSAHNQLGDVPSRVVFLHARKQPPDHPLPWGINQQGPLWENGYRPVFPEPSNEIAEFDPWKTGRIPWWNFRFLGVSLSGADQLLWRYQGTTQRDEPLIPVDETREPSEHFHNIDPADMDRLDSRWNFPQRGRRGLAPFANEFEREVIAFRDEHGHFPATMMVVADRDWTADYPDTPRRSIGALGINNLPDRYRVGDSYFDNETIITHLSVRTALGDAMRTVRDRYGVRTELSEYGEYPSWPAGSDSARNRMFREIGLRLKRAKDIDGALPGSPWFAIPWPEPTL